jgi:hypothetical protein
MIFDIKADGRYKARLCVGINSHVRMSVVLSDLHIRTSVVRMSVIRTSIVRIARMSVRPYLVDTLD